MKLLSSAHYLLAFVINYYACNAVETTIDAEKEYVRDESLSVVSVTYLFFDISSSCV